MSSHGGEDVAAYASGPSSGVFAGLIENTDIFYFICHIAELEGCRKKSFELPEPLKFSEDSKNAGGSDILTPMFFVSLMFLVTSVGLNFILMDRLKKQKRQMTQENNVER